MGANATQARCVGASYVGGGGRITRSGAAPKLATFAKVMKSIT
jgi:hypothetical protein